MRRYAIPVLAWVAAAAGLTLALFGEGSVDLLATALAALPLLLIAERIRASRPTSKEET